MASRKSPPSTPPRSSGRPGTGKPGASASGKGPQGRRPSTSIVNQKQRPWGLIITAIVIVVFAVGIVVYAVAGRSSSSHKPATSPSGMAQNKANAPYEKPALPAAMAIKGVTYKVEKNHQHVNGTVNYDASPPIGGNHSQFWANCTGTVYDHQIANENAVHMLEHGAIWITYNPKTIAAGDLKILENKVSGIDRLALSPYAGLKTPISLQAWGYQLFVNRANDPRIDQFISVLKYNPKVTPEYGASCSDPYFKPADSTPGHPQV